MATIVRYNANRSDLMTIADMNKTDTARVISLNGLDKTFVERLMDIGLYEGATVTLLNILAMGRLFLLEVDDVEICIRRDDAAQIEVQS